MISESDPSYPDDLPCGVQNRNQFYSEVVDTSLSSATQGSDTQLKSFLCSLSILKEKVNQVQSYVNMFVPQGNYHAPHQQTLNHDSNSSMALASMGNVIQEIIVTASSMMFNCQQLGLGSPNEGNDHDHVHNHNHHHHMTSTSLIGVGNNDQSIFDGEGFYNMYADYITSTTTTTTTTTIDNRVATTTNNEKKGAGKNRIEQEAYDIIELEASDLLAKYTHYCQVCGKGFKRDANLRMHMRAHGDEYKSRASLSNPLKKINDNGDQSCPIKVARKYSCPHEGCRWNKKHVKFQPLKSIICVKNHYKRSHCPKMYVCKRCNRKQFSVLSDLRTHEKHCGDLKWQCSCGTTFSRKDKLMGHVALFVGHTPLVNPLGTLDNKLDNQLGVQIQFKEC